MTREARYETHTHALFLVHSISQKRSSGLRRTKAFLLRYLWGALCSLTQLAWATGLYEQEADASHLPGKDVLLEPRSFSFVTSDQSKKAQEVSC